MKRVLGTSVATVLAAGVAVALAVSGTQAAATPGWRFVATYPQAASMANVSASGPANAWTVGYNTYCCELFVSHWNGKKWQTITAPPLIQGGGFTDQVTGASIAAISGGRAMILVSATDEELGTNWVNGAEWTGTSWSAVHQFAGFPGDVIASGPADVWGFETGNGTPRADHYNGKSWSLVPIPVNVTQASGSAAAGDWVMGTVAAQPTRVEVLHWGSGAWRNVPLPKISVPGGDQMMPGLIAPALSPASVWATVSVGPVKGAGRVTLILLHWNGKAWTRVPLPKGLNPGSLASDGHGGAWMNSNATMYHYSGGRWTHVSLPAKPGLTTRLQGDMELIPGTRSVLADAELWDSWHGVDGTVLKYGP